MVRLVGIRAECDVLAKGDDLTADMRLHACPAEPHCKLRIGMRMGDQVVTQLEHEGATERSFVQHVCLGHAALLG